MIICKFSYDRAKFGYDRPFLRFFGVIFSIKISFLFCFVSAICSSNSFSDKSAIPCQRDDCFSGNAYIGKFRGLFKRDIVGRFRNIFFALFPTFFFQHFPRPALRPDLYFCYVVVFKYTPAINKNITRFC